jgi:hypothetical protein
MSPQFANARAGEVGDVAGLVRERINGWIRSYPAEATSSALKDGVIIKGRPVDWAWAIPGASEYLVVTFSDSHKQYVVRTELPDLATLVIAPVVAPVAAAVVARVIAPEVAPQVAPQVAPEVAPEARITPASQELVISETKAADPEPAQQGETSSDEETAQPLPDLDYLADVARSRVYAWIRSYPLNATSCVLGDGSHIPGRPVGWAWAIPGTVEFLVVEFSDGHKQYLSPEDLPDSAGRPA